MEAVRFDEVSKRFVIHHERSRTFQEVALNLLRLRHPNGTREEFWALRDVTFAVERGRTLGIIGRNGSGKSTLLKLLAGTMQPTSGQVIAHGRVFGLLELAAGFHPELSGRENVFLNGTFLGLSRREMAARLDQIVAFAELEQFIDTPVKHYSSGMYMRLGFAIAISVAPDILVIDEVLAVGDAPFRQKCFAALAEFKARQKTILFVTHDAGAVRRFCDEALWLDQGQVRGAGPADAVLRDYLAATQTTHGTALATQPVPDDYLGSTGGVVEILSAEMVDATGRPERHFQSHQVAGVRVRYRARQALEAASIGVGLHRADGLYLLGTSTGAAGQTLRLEAGDGETTCWLGPLPLAAGEYTVSAAVWNGNAAGTGAAQPAHRLYRAARFAVRPPRKDQAGTLALAPRWGGAAQPAAGADTPLPPVPALPAGSLVEGSWTDQALPVDGFYARWGRAPSRITMGEHDDEYLGPGWYPPEDWPPKIRWTAARAVAYLTQDEWMSSAGIIMCRPQHDARPPTGRVLVNGRVVGRFEAANPALEPFTFPLDPVDAPQEVEVAVEVDLLLDPAATGTSDDRRVLGVAVHALWLE